MLMWSCDLIIGADDVVFADVVGTRLGMCGLEYFAHPWEFGARKTKELLLTGDSIDVHEAHSLGMVSKVFPRAELETKTLDFARRLDDQGVGEPDTGQPGVLQQLAGLLHVAPAEPLALGRGPRGRFPCGAT
jgi:enoyl-CoA hydratase/carnithine racemase